MSETVRECLDKYPEEVAELFNHIRQLIYESASCVPEEKLWAKLPSYYVGEAFVRLIPFKDHINIEASAIVNHADELTGYKLTPKGMLRIDLKQAIPCDILKTVFAETLNH